MRNRKRRGGVLRALLLQIREDRRSFAVFASLTLCVLALILHSVLLAEWNHAFLGTITLILLFLPPVLEHNFKIKLPTTLEILAFLFVFCAGVLGEVAGFYERFAWWDDMLHACNGFMFAAFGFCLVALADRKGADTRPYPASLIALVAFCFSMTVGALWELFEYTTDHLLQTDMQKDSILHGIHTAALPREAGQRVRHLDAIERTVIFTKGGERVEFSGYLDVGLADTMTDLFVNLLGALVFCAIGYVYLKHRRGFAAQFIPTVQGK